MKKVYLLTLALATIAFAGFSQTDRFWSVNNENRNNIVKDKAVSRVAYPLEYKLFNLNSGLMGQELLSIVQKNAVKNSTIISLPNALGHLEDFEVVEASNFEPALQAQFPDIRAYSGKGISDKYATLKLSYSPQGIQTMVFRTGKENEFIEAYSQDHQVYSVYKAQRDKSKLGWTCSTPEQTLAQSLQSQVDAANVARVSSGTIKTMRLAQSCNGEYSNYFGATSSAQVNLVLAAYNATLTRANGVYEKDLALHLNLIANTTAVIYYSPSTDPYSTTLSQWNAQLQSTLTSVIGEANYDIGHMFGASGGGGNAGCIGCVCVNGSKGSGITSPFDGIPQGDNFDIDYVVHEVGHQLGGNHTFSHSLEGTGVNKEVGSGITIMGYAGITSYDVAPHSIDIFHQASINQIQNNIAPKTCPVTVNMTANTAPVVASVANRTIPISTPFALTGSATDAQNDPLTYCWEQNDNSTVSGSSSVASPTKASGPNWLSFLPTTSATRTFPRLSTILSGLNVTPTLPGGDAAANIEALSSVSRTLNFTLTVRDNSPYNPGVTIGQTATTDVAITVTNTSGPFAVTSPNTNITWNVGGTATVTWSVNNTTAAPVSCASVNILLSTDGGQTFSTVLASATANDGSEVITVPASQGSTCRVKVEAVGNIFFDISNANFTIGAPALCGNPTGLISSAITQTSATVSWSAVSGANNYDVDYKASASGTWINAATGTIATSANLSGLSAGTLYDWRVRANCTAGAGSYVQALFTTATPPVTCPGIYDIATNGNTAGAALIPLNTDVKGTVSAAGDNDYYRFVITTGGTITLSLTTLPANYQLALLNSAGTVLQSSTNSGTNSETINRTVTAGTYYARVYPRNNNQFNASSCYTLRVQTGTAARMEEKGIYVDMTDKLTVFPNPVKGAATLIFNADAAGIVTLTLTNRTGVIVLRKNISVDAGTNQRRLDVGKIPSGVYFIKLQNADAIQVAKMVISN